MNTPLYFPMKKQTLIYGREYKCVHLDYYFVKDNIISKVSKKSVIIS